MEGGEGKVVCVTGSSGYIASWLVKLLLQRGYTVRATVRDPNDPNKTEHLLSLDGAKERLQLLKADLLEEGSFDSAVDGCEGVFHTASPITLSVNDPQADLIEPAVNGTLNVLKSCAKARSVKRVVITSSMASMIYNGRPLNAEVVVDETWFSDPAYCKENKFWYMLSKTLAEDAAWKFAKENGIDVITIHPGAVVGPLLQPVINVGSKLILDAVNGSRTYPNSTLRFVDVRDVANAHIRALEVPSASGRYCVTGTVAHFSEVLKILREHYPALDLPEEAVEDQNFLGLQCQVSKEKAKSLGIDFTPLDVMIIDTIESFKEKGIITA